jgi:hypothetical protein
VTILVSFAASCGRDVPGGSAAHSSTHTDSAGVDIVLHVADAGDIPVFATLDSVPSLRLGALDGRPEEQFGSIVDVLPLPDGGVAVLDGQAAEIRVFDASGRYRTTLGSKGDGPGELRMPSALGRVGDDTIAVFDRRLLRVTRFALDGGVGAITTLATEGRPISRATFLPNGFLVGQSPWTADVSGRFVPPPEGAYTFVRDTALLMVYDPAGAALDSLEVLPNSESIRRVRMESGSLSLFSRAAVFGLSLVFQAHSDGVWSGFNDRFELHLRDAADGHLVRVVRAPGLERAATEDMAERIRDAAVSEGEQLPERLQNLDEWFSLSPRPEKLPAYDRIVVDDRARLWVREWSAIGGVSRWWIFSAAGDLLGSAHAPERATLYAVRCGAAWGILTDQLEVSFVVRYTVNEAASEASDCGAAGE